MLSLPTSGNVGDLFLEKDDDDVAVIDLTKRRIGKVSYARLNAGCRSVARGLRARGIQPQERVAILSSNQHEFYEVFFGSMRAGCVPLQLNIQLEPEMIRTLLLEASPSVVFTNASLASSVPDSMKKIIIDSKAYGEFCDAGPFDSYAPQRQDLAFIPYSSGTTGLPKGILLTHANALWALRQLAEFIILAGNKPERVIVAHPLYHKNAMLASKSTFLGGGCIVLQQKFNEQTYLKAVERYGVSRLRAVPTMMARLVAHKELLSSFDLSSIRAVQMGSGPIAERLYDEVKEAFPQASLRVGYGLTEAGPMQFGPHPRGKPSPRLSIGFPLKDCEVKLVDGPNQDEGRFHVRNPGVMQGYLNRPEETAAKLSSDGWFDSGDVLRRDSEGFFYFVGRADDMFVVGGHNVYPAAVERILLKHEKIEETCVVAVNDHVRGQAPHAFVVLRPGASLTEDEIKQFFLRHGPAYQHPRRVHFLEALPLQGTNKVDSRKLAVMAQETVEQAVSTSRRL